MSRKRKTYTQEFKDEAVRLVLEGKHGLAQVSRDLGIHPTQLRRWKQKYEDVNGLGSPRRIVTAARDDELRQLREENRRLREEHEILKKSVAIFSRGPK